MRWIPSLSFVVVTFVLALGATGLARAQAEEPPKPLPAGAARAPRLGLALNVPEGGGEAEYLAALRSQIRLGLDGLAISVKWSDVEKSPGQYDWKVLDDALGIGKFLGAEVALTVQTIDTNQRTLPADLQDKGWGDPGLRQRWQRFLATLVPRLGPAVKWVSLGNEVDGYLAAKPDELDAFAEFLTEGRAVLRQARLGLPVGVTLMAHELSRAPQVAARLVPLCDVVFWTYYPIQADFSIRPAEQWTAPWRAALAASGGKPVVLQEVGIPSSPLLGSSPEIQAEFVRVMLAEVARDGRQVQLVSVFMAVDFGPKALDVLLAYYGFHDPRFRAYLGSLGLFTATGTPKPAWQTFRQWTQGRGK